MPRTSRSASSSGSLSSSTAYPVYTTYTEEELQQAFAKLSHIGTNGKTSGNHANFAKNGSASRGSRGSKLIKSHECSVSFPDGTSGLCKYTRGGPTWHVFRFEQEGDGFKAVVPFALATRPSYLPTRNCTERMANTTVSIEAKAAELAQVAFAEAIALEYKDRFKRAIAPHGYNRYRLNGAAQQAASPQMSVKRAKEVAGKYALCLRIGSQTDNYRLIPCTGVNNRDVFDTIEEANEAWKNHEHRARRFVACLCRFSRQWELPVYNSLHADPQYAALLGINHVDTGAAEATDEARASPSQTTETACVDPATR